MKKKSKKKADKKADKKLKAKTKIIAKTNKPHLKVKFAGDKAKPWKGSFPTDATSADIITTSVSASGNAFTLPQKEFLMESVDMAKTYKPYLSKAKIGLSFKKGLYFEVERKPAKIVKKKIKG